jgi:hypothetical protein
VVRSESAFRMPEAGLVGSETVFRWVSETQEPVWVGVVKDLGSGRPSAGVRLSSRLESEKPFDQQYMSSQSLERSVGEDARSSRCLPHRHG